MMKRKNKIWSLAAVSVLIALVFTLLSQQQTEQTESQAAFLRDEEPYGLEALSLLTGQTESVFDFGRAGKRNIRFALSEDHSRLVLTIFGAGYNAQQMALPLEEGQAVSDLSFRVDRVDFGKGSPPSVRLRIEGGADGGSYTSNYILSLVDDRIAKTFSYRSELDSYFNTGLCSYLSKSDEGEMRIFEESVKEAKKDFGAFQLTRSKLHWNKETHVFEKEKPEPQEPWLTPTTERVVYSAPKAKTRLKEALPKETRLKLSGFRVCQPEDGIKNCDPGLPAEMPRWYQALLPDGKEVWLLGSDEVDTNLRCTL